ncbi:hypothetical protein Acr_04g0002560 [Actinidia rufa]|nr:hypothetical protein Acr_04g0002560 [Actinidia rufa]
METSRHAMEVEENLEVPPPVDPNAQILQLQWQDEERIHEEHGDIPMHKQVLVHGGMEGIHRKKELLLKKAFGMVFRVFWGVEGIIGTNRATSRGNHSNPSKARRVC